MIELVLFAGRVLLVVVLYLFLFAVMRTGVADIPGTIARNTAPKRFAIDQPVSIVPVAA